jgi:hypothetical protein
MSILCQETAGISFGLTVSTNPIGVTMEEKAKKYSLIGHHTSRPQGIVPDIEVSVRRIPYGIEVQAGQVRTSLYAGSTVLIQDENMKVLVRMER